MQGFSLSQSPTLSVGIAIGHCLEPLEDLLRAARDAERNAKQGTRPDGSDDRNGLAVHLATRGSEPVRMRAQWASGVPARLSPEQRLEQWIRYLLQNKLSSRAAYDLHGLAADYAVWMRSPEPDLLVQDLKRLLRKKRAGGKELSAEVIEALASQIHTREDLDLIARELIIARHMVEAYRQAAAAEGDQK